MTRIFKSDVQCLSGGYAPIVHEYEHGEIIKTYDFVDAPIFDNALSAYIYAQKESENLNRRLRHEER